MIAQKTRKEGLSQQAYKTIKNMILRNELSQGEFISEASLQERLGIGRTPVREAVLQLSQDQLVTIYPRKGIAVARISPKSVRDIFEIRSILEPEALRKGASKLAGEWLREMRDRFAGHSNETAPISREDAIKLADLDDQFHSGLIGTMENQYANGLMRSFMDYLVIIRSTVTATDTSRFRESNEEHIKIIDAILAGDVELACERLSEHIRISFDESIRKILDWSY
jgi:DNA-binding GntR family transcriptional regulator